MGNCLFGGLGEPPAGDHSGGGGNGFGMIKVITSNGGIMEFSSPVTTGCITDELPGHAIFRSHDLFWKPLCHREELVPGKSYYLLPIGQSYDNVVRQGHIRSNSAIPTTSLVAPYRMSLDYQGTLKRSYTEIFSRENNKYLKNNGFWKVKLVISPEQLAEILSQETRTQELIESVRTVAKCGNVPVSSSSSSSMAFSDQWSLSSSRNESCKKDDFSLLDF
ncbi:uncharacterized protein LOC110816537 [Carica papaya]|uniref:uncharacterized protein LOC110816537 n=1 Tax=Carica papaya TaxID=3649 RepID=UPI000B8CC59C|nr:uncharacterized protein LOC110816537 [Carica papaya]